MGLSRDFRQEHGLRRLSTLNACSKSKTWLCVSNCQTGTTDLNTMPGLSGAMCWTTRCAGREANLQAAGACRPFVSLLGLTGGHCRHAVVEVRLILKHFRF